MRFGNIDWVRDKLQRATRLDARLLVIAGVGLVFGLPCLLYGYPFYGDDSVEHAIYYTHFANQLWHGDLYPRWLQGMNGGLGSPTFYYYPPVPYYLTSALKVFFANDPHGWQQLAVAAVLAVIASGLSLYLWLQQNVHRRSALIAAILYMAVPYHLNFDLYSRGAFAELWTFVWMPLVVCAVDGIIANHRFATVCLTVSYALLIMTHLPTTLIFSLVPMAYAFHQATTGQRTRALGLTVGAMSLGIGLSAIYLVPALAMQKFIFLSDATAGHYYYGNWFLFTKLNWSGARSDLFWMTIEVAGLACVGFALSRFTSSGMVRKKAAFWFGTALLCVLMMTSLSRPLWELISPLQKVQFPWRLNTVLSLAAAILIALAIDSLKRIPAPAMLLQAILSLLFLSWMYDTSWRAWYAYPSHYVDQAVIEDRNTWLEQNREQNEFRPRWVVSLKKAELESLLRRLDKSNDMPVVTILRGAGTVAIDSWKVREIALQVDTADGAVLNISQFYFPGWRAWLDNSQLLEVQPSVPGGLLSLAVPGGKHTVLLELGRKTPEVVGQLVSATSAILTLILFIWSYFSRHPLSAKVLPVASRYQSKVD